MKSFQLKFNNFKKKNNSFEFREQCKLFKLASFIPELKWMFAVPNGAKRTAYEGAMLKNSGLKAGVSDIFLPIASSGYHGMFIEMKYGDNKPSQAQKEFIKDMKIEGYKCIVCYSASEALDSIIKYIKEKRYGNKEKSNFEQV